MKRFATILTCMALMGMPVCMTSCADNTDIDNSIEQTSTVLGSTLIREFNAERIGIPRGSELDNELASYAIVSEDEAVRLLHAILDSPMTSPVSKRTDVQIIPGGEHILTTVFRSFGDDFSLELRLRFICKEGNDWYYKSASAASSSQVFMARPHGFSIGAFRANGHIPFCSRQYLFVRVADQRSVQPAVFRICLDAVGEFDTATRKADFRMVQSE